MRCYYDYKAKNPISAPLLGRIGAAVLQNADTIMNDDGTTSFVPSENIYLAALVVAILLLVVLVVEFKMLKKKDFQDRCVNTVQEVEHE